ncbi:ERF family protein [Solidesulfovibrio carbinolicus]|uniref:Single-stranded DNA-binding protein n=1 Tax=Solidesulfovibrio carbinolicus TaxID=296842 RepID=A0A4P6HJH7_9BACT|nr:ERF family protein [Solidesulfovibrio carbinolicus]QAZ67257.1 single-stranded DNA-binding protein [Solidesulfovibrio carbinolicus]
MENYQSTEISELAKALINVQRTIQPAVKDATNPFVQNRYATLNSVMDSCREALLGNSIWMTQFPVPAEPGYLGLVTKLTHAESGQWQSSLAVVPLPKADPQGMGSAMTYARRYALSAMLGIVTDDDDGEDAKMPTKTTSPSRRPQNAPLAHKGTPSDERPGQVDKNASDSKHGVQNFLALLPRIDGITYQTVPADGGQTCIIATGNTAAKKALLSEAGFRWNPQRKVWWRYAHAS